MVPVPFRPEARRKRGWDPVADIARQLKKRHGVQTSQSLKREDGQSQKTLDFASRITNLSGKITYSGPSRVPRKAILIDDVFTTGATLHECASVLRGHGVESVRAITLALDA